MPKGKSQLLESELIECAYTIRQMSLPPSVKLTKRSMLRWFALAFGLISENESRSTILDILDSLFYFQFSKNFSPASEDLLYHFKQKNKQISDKLLLYHLKRLSNLKLIQRKKGHYSFVQDPHSEKYDISTAFNTHISKPINSTLSDIESVLAKLSSTYKK